MQGSRGSCSTRAGAVWLLGRGVLDGLWQPLTNVYMNRLVDSRLRATMPSLASVSGRFVLAVAGCALVLAAPVATRLPAKNRVIPRGA